MLVPASPSVSRNVSIPQDKKEKQQFRKSSAVLDQKPILSVRYTSSICLIHMVFTSLQAA
jgi:hypothetical protein